MPETPSVHEALAAVLDSLGPIAKDGTAPANMGGYKFRRVEDITAALKPLFAKHGILCVPSVMSRVESQRQTASNKILYCVDLDICFRFIGPQGDELAANVWGQGTDSGDKATQKAVTSAFKTMLSVVFCISDSELDAEGHDVPETTRAPTRPVPASTARVEAVKEIVLENDLIDWVKDQEFPWPWPESVCVIIEAKAQEQATTPDEPVMTRAMSKANEAAKAAAGPDAADFSPDPF